MIYTINKEVLLEEAKGDLINPRKGQTLETADPRDFTNTILPIAGNIATRGIYAAPVVAGAFGQNKYKLDNTSLDIKDHPFDSNMVKQQTILNNADQRLAQSYDTNTKQYFLNPFVSGPLTHFIIKSRKLANRGATQLFGSDEAKEKLDNVNRVYKTSGAPFDSGIQGSADAFKDYAASASKTASTNPGQYLLNPFVPGPVTHLGATIGSAVTGTIAGVLSPRDTRQAIK